MNKVQLVGRIVRDPEFRANANGDGGTTRFSIAVNRRFKNAEGNYDADFPNCVAFGKTSEFIDKWFHRGDMIGVVGRIQTGSYTNKDGVKVYTTDVVVDEAEFVGGKTENSQNTSNNTTDTSFNNIPDGIEGDLPFK